MARREQTSSYRTDAIASSCAFRVMWQIVTAGVMPVAYT
jgi:hypothetical protein